MQIQRKSQPKAEIKMCTEKMSCILHHRQIHLLIILLYLVGLRFTYTLLYKYQYFHKVSIHYQRIILLSIIAKLILNVMHDI